MLQNKFEKLLHVFKKKFSMLLEPVIGYTRVVFATKYILSAIAVILMLTLILLPLLNPVQDNFRITFSKIEDDDGNSPPKMTNPRFQGVDKEGQTYNVAATSATKFKDEMFILNRINGSLELNNGTFLTLKSNKGVFKPKEHYLELSDSVHLFTDNGYDVYSEAILINTKKSEAYSKNKVYGKSPIGTIEADNFTTYEKGMRTIFKGNVKVVLHPNKIENFSAK